MYLNQFLIVQFTNIILLYIIFLYINDVI